MTSTLTPLGPADAAAHLAGEDAEIIRWLNGSQSTVESVEQYLEQCATEWQEPQSATHLAFGIRADDGTLAGNCDIRTAEPYLAPGEANLSYAVFPSYRRRGYATAAVESLVAFLAGRADVSVAVIRADPANVASAEVARAAGFTYLEQRHEPSGLFDLYVRSVRTTPGAPAPSGVG